MGDTTMSVRSPHPIWWFACFLASMLFLSTAHAQGRPEELRYRGYLTDSNGVALEGDHAITFRLYDKPTVGEPVWSETRTVKVSRGLFSVQLGGTESPFPPDSFAESVWLGIEVAAAGETGRVSPPSESSTVRAVSARRDALVDLSCAAGEVSRFDSRSWECIELTEAAASAAYSEFPGFFFLHTTAIFGDTTESGADTVYSTASGANGWAVRAHASGASGRGVFGSATATGATTNYGGYFMASGDNGRGVYAYTGGKNSRAVWARVYNTSPGLPYGGYFEVDSPSGYGVYAKLSGTTLTGWTFRGEGLGTASNGAWFRTTGEDTTALLARAESTSGSWNTNVGGHLEAGGDRGTGVKAIATGSYGTGLYASGGANGYAATFSGNVRILSKVSPFPTILELGEGLDYAEGFDVTESTSVEPGAVLVIDPDNPGKLKPSSAAYDRKVAGIAAGGKGLGSGVRLGVDRFDIDVALAGRVYCNVDATEHGVVPGDLLTTAPRPGHAMKVTDHGRAQGAVLGKAMERLDQGRTGQILVLVTLQ